MLDIIVDEYLDSATSTNVLIGMSLVSRWAESKRGLPAEFSNVFFMLSSCFLDVGVLYLYFN